MLNELHSLSNSLSAMGVSLEQWHQEYHTLPKMRTNAPCVRIWIDSDGKIPSFDLISEELAANPVVREKYLGRNFEFRRKHFDEPAPEPEDE